jgi:uncharacterized membrane protein
MEQKTNRLTGDLFLRPEGRILLTGIGVFLVFFVFLFVQWIYSPQYCKEVLSLVTTRIVAGRPGGVYFGHVLGIGYLTNVSVNLLVDVVAVFLLYPLFIFGVENLLSFRSLKKFLGRIHITAKANYKIVKTYGVCGLFLFVLFPLWGTGPVVGCMIGYMMGLRPWANMSIVTSATLLAIVLWFFVLEKFHAKMLEYSFYMPFTIIILLVVAAVVIHLKRILTANR